MWDLIFLKPMLNVLITLYSVLGHNFGVAIIVFTILVRIITLPLTWKQMRASRVMAGLQPKLQELQKRCAKDKQRLSQETFKLYREAGISPLGCLLPMLAQLPVWIALYQSIMRAMVNMADLDKYLYSWDIVRRAVPLSPDFLWLNLSRPDSYYVLPVIVAATTWIQQKMMTPAATDPQQRSMSNIMLWMMPVMFGFFTLSFPSGLALYWVVSNIAGAVIQYLYTGWGGLQPYFRPKGVVSSQPDPRDKK